MIPSYIFELSNDLKNYHSFLQNIQRILRCIHGTCFSGLNQTFDLFISPSCLFWHTLAPEHLTWDMGRLTSSDELQRMSCYKLCCCKIFHVLRRATKLHIYDCMTSVSRPDKTMRINDVFWYCWGTTGWARNNSWTKKHEKSSFLWRLKGRIQEITSRMIQSTHSLSKDPYREAARRSWDWGADGELAALSPADRQ